MTADPGPIVGKNVLTSRDDEVLVPLEKADGIDRVIATERED